MSRKRGQTADLVVAGHAPGDAAVEGGLHLHLGHLRLPLPPGLLRLPCTQPLLRGRSGEQLHHGTTKHNFRLGNSARISQTLWRKVERLACGHDESAYRSNHTRTALIVIFAQSLYTTCCYGQYVVKAFKLCFFPAGRWRCLTTRAFMASICFLVRPSSGMSSVGPPRMYTRVLRPNLNMSPTLHMPSFR